MPRLVDHSHRENTGGCVCVCVPVHEIAHEAVLIVAAYSSLLVIAVDIDIDNGMRMIFTEDLQ